MSPKAVIVLMAVAVTFLSALGLVLYGFLAGLRVALRFLMPLLLIFLVLLLLSSLLGGSRTSSRPS
ncbi:MAG: hypothetical protein QXP81_04750 [Nitrososphaerota archaeon]